MYRFFLGLVVLMSAGVAVAFSQEGTLISVVHVKMLSELVGSEIFSVDSSKVQQISNVTWSSAAWLFGFSLVGFALFVNRRKV